MTLELVSSPCCASTLHHADSGLEGVEEIIELEWIVILMATRLLLTGDGTTRSGRCWIECGVLEEHANSRLMNIKPYCSTKALVTSRKKKFLPQRTPNPSQTRLGPALTQPPPHSKSPVPNQQPATTRERQAKSEGTKKKKKPTFPYINIRPIVH